MRHLLKAGAAACTCGAAIIMVIIFSSFKSPVTEDKHTPATGRAIQPPVMKLYPDPPGIYFESNMLNITEYTYYRINACTKYAEYQVSMSITKAPAGDAVVTLTAGGTSTATPGKDYDFTTNGSFTSPSNTLVFSSGIFPASKTFTIRVYDDGETEPTEQIKFDFTVSGATDAIVSAYNPAFTLTISDNDPLRITPIATSPFEITNSSLVNTTGLYNFYSTNPQQSNIIASISNSSSVPECLAFYISTYGSGWGAFGTGSRSRKSLATTSLSQVPVSTYKISLYFTAQELAGKDPATLWVAKSPYKNAQGQVESQPSPANTTAAYTSFTPYADGYKFTGVFMKDCGSIMARYFLVDNTVSVPLCLTFGFNPGITSRSDNDILDENDVNAGFQVTNPFTRQIKIQFAKPQQGDLMLQLLAGDGRTVLQKKVAMTGKASTEINLPQLASGEYFLVVMANNKRYQKKLIKQ